MFVISFNIDPKIKYVFLVLLMQWVKSAKASCQTIEDGWGLEEYEDINNCWSEYDDYINENVRKCRQKNRRILIGPRIISCINTSIEEVFRNNDNHYEKNHTFFVKDSYLNNLVVDGKKWPRITNLTIENGNISSIIPGFFTGFVDLLELSISKNRIPYITDGVFSSLTNLKSLMLTQNHIAHFGPHAFTGLLALISLDVSKNEIVDLPSNILLSLTKLNYLDFSENKITHLNENFNLLSLKKINFNQNSFREVDFQDFIKDNFENFDLSQNAISRIKNLKTFKADVVNLAFNSLEVIEEIGEIVEFNMSYNKIKVLENDFASKSVTKLDLSFNLITNISVNAFLKSNQLKRLYLNKNHLKTLPSACFKSLSALEYLDLSFNNILHLEFGTINALQNLRYLNLSHNRGLLDFHMFFGLSLLEELDIEENNIKNFDGFFLSSHRHLRKIKMGNNSWNCITLVKMISLLESSRITVIKGNDVHISNIYGIACNTTLNNDTLLTEKVNLASKNIDTPLISDKENKSIDNLKYEHLDNFFNKIIKSLHNIEHNLNVSNNTLQKDSPGYFNNVSYKILQSLINIEHNLSQSISLLEKDKPEHFNNFSNKIIKSLNNIEHQLNQSDKMFEKDIYFHKIMNSLNNVKHNSSQSNNSLEKDNLGHFNNFSDKIVTSLKNIEHNLNENNNPEHASNILDKIIKSLNNIEKQLNQTNHSLEKNNLVKETVNQTKMNKSSNASSSSWYSTMNLTFTNILFIILICGLVIFIKNKNKVNRQVIREEVELIS